jgi:hypothetical protein
MPKAAAECNRAATSKTGQYFWFQVLIGGFPRARSVAIARISAFCSFQPPR